MSDIYLNVLPAIDLTSLGFTHVAGSFAATSITTGADCCKADGDGKYDIQFSFPTAAGSAFSKDNSGALASPFQSIYTVNYTGAGVLNANSFFAFSTPDGGEGTFLAAAHVQAITDTSCTSGDCSAWVGAVPLPAAAWLLAPAVAGLAGFARRRRAAA